MIRRRSDVKVTRFSECHDGVGTLDCFSMLDQGDSELGFSLFHYDTLPPGASVGEHFHNDNEEIYFLVSGNCHLIFDGVKSKMASGDFSIVTRGHSHGLINDSDTDAILIVVGINN